MAFWLMALAVLDFYQLLTELAFDGRNKQQIWNFLTVCAVSYPRHLGSNNLTVRFRIGIIRVGSTASSQKDSHLLSYQKLQKSFKRGEKRTPTFQSFRPKLSDLDSKKEFALLWLFWKSQLRCSNIFDWLKEISWKTSASKTFS